MFSQLTVRFPNALSQPLRVHRLSYRQANYEHDYARVLFRDWDLDISRIRPGSPMVITLDSKEFVGYVHDVKVTSDNNSNFTEVGFIGASYVMRQSSQKTFYNQTGSAIAESLAKKYNFAYKVQPHPRVYKQVSQAGLTDWQLLVKIAKECGYFVRMDSTTLVFQSVTSDFEEYITETPVFSKVDAGFKPLNPIYSFSPVVGETLGHEGADRSATAVAGVDPETGKFFKYTKPRRSAPTRQISQPELFDRFSTTSVAPGYEIAKFSANSIDDRSRFPYIAEAEVLGTSRLVVGRAVYLENVGAKYSGYWTVLELTHEVVEDSLNMYKYTTVISVGSDSLGPSAQARFPQVPNKRGVRNISPAIKGTRVAPRNVIKSPSINVKPLKTVKLVDRLNRAADGGVQVSQATWGSTSGNLSNKVKPATRSAVAAKKAVTHFGRQ